MFLLIPLMKNGTFSGLGKFTFHNVSINTELTGDRTLHLTDLHSTMFLLIHITSCVWMPVPNVFTFHNVSINTVYRVSP